MTRTALPLLAALVAVAAAPAALAQSSGHSHSHSHGHSHASETRELGAHVHGHASLAIAVEGTEVGMTLTAPGADVAGFEHAPESDADRAAVRAAIATLSDPLALFALPAAAGCTLASAEVRLFKLDEDGAEAVDLDAKPHGHAHGHDHGHEAHTEFRAEYRLTCADPSAIDAIRFAWFDAFPASEEVEVELVSDAGARAFEVARDAPVLDLAGAI